MVYITCECQCVWSQSTVPKTNLCPLPTPPTKKQKNTLIHVPSSSGSSASQALLNFPQSTLAVEPRCGPGSVSDARTRSWRRSRFFQRRNDQKVGPDSQLIQMAYGFWIPNQFNTRTHSRASELLESLAPLKPSSFKH